MDTTIRIRPEDRDLIRYVSSVTRESYAKLIRRLVEAEYERLEEEGTRHRFLKHDATSITVNEEHSHTNIGDVYANT